MWSCGKQPLLSASTAEAELISMAEGFTMGRSLKPLIIALCEQAGMKSNITLYTDSNVVRRTPELPH